MKKLLAILGAFGLTVTGATTVVACNKWNNKTKDTLGGLKASDFEKSLLRRVDDEDTLNIRVITIVANTVKDPEKSKEINMPLFRNAFVVTYKLGDGVTFPLKKGDKITLTIKKATDVQIKESYKEDTDREISAEFLTVAKKVQGYVSGTEFSSEITIED
ncbi:hypothetical protein S100390_v1c06960 [Spiroplasma sp. NBRC 100390]|uniref:lipoprotein n=1 Tax=unclassified Spiroplasma TaxID=2637901 RepID=UPI0008928681|nr:MULTISPECIES: lipoprotein [unclassified Spiroplasma]AOX44032.1 hypothetical protein STU14_v1c06960 [Spiroplasma sp. TU-14]APE13502.1 hypothetical protein S100390_v1c06960 [Spiroplasma sp. NBRC 100390]